jgi:hypothetical protein
MVIKSKAVCSTHVEVEIVTQFESEILEIRNHSAELGADGMMILKYFFEKRSVIFWTRIIGSVWGSVGIFVNTLVIVKV